MPLSDIVKTVAMQSCFCILYPQLYRYCRWIALPDAQAGTDFYTVSYSPPTYGTEFAVLNIQDEPVNVRLTYTGRATPDTPGTEFNLQPGGVLQIQVS